MNLKNKVLCVIALSMFVVGCNANSDNTIDPVADKATQQKTMTKVQNDVNEIMNKDYDYIIQNMGIPYCTTYYLDTKELDDNNIYNLNDIRLTTDLRMVYPKYSSNNELANSALYIELHNNNVTEVQTYEFSKYDIKEEPIRSNINLILDMYDDGLAIQLNTVQGNDFNKYIGLKLEELNDIVNLELSNFEVYDKYRESMVMGFVLDDKSNDTHNVLTVYEEDNIIKDIKILDENQIINTIKEKLIK